MGNKKKLNHNCNNLSKRYNCFFCFLLVFIVSFICVAGQNVNARENNKDIGGTFKKIATLENLHVQSAICLNDGNLLFPDLKKIYNPITGSLRDMAPFLENFIYYNDDGFLLNDGRVLFIGPYNTLPEETMKKEIWSLFWEDLLQQEMNKYKKAEDMTDDVYMSKIRKKVYKHWDSLSDIEKKDLWYSKMQKNPILFEKYKKSISDFENSMHAQLYNPRTNEFTLTGKVNIRRSEAKKLQLNDGRIFIIGGFAYPGGEDHYKRISKIEIYNPKNGEFRLLENNKKMEYIGNISLLHNNKILIMYTEKYSNKHQCGRESYTYYDYKTETFSESFPICVNFGRTLKLTNGNILLFRSGRVKSEKFFDRYITNEIIEFNPYTQEFTELGKMLVDRGQGFEFGCVELKDNKILIYGGKSYSHSKRIKNAEIFDLKTGKSTLIGDMNYEHYADNAILLDNGTVFITGTSPEFYIPNNKK